MCLAEEKVPKSEGFGFRLELFDDGDYGLPPSRIIGYLSKDKFGCRKKIIL
jgi:hypothetical protein